MFDPCAGPVPGQAEQGAPTTLAPAYRRHRPERTALYAIIEEHYPFPLRFLLAAHPKVLTEVLAVVQRGISPFLVRRAGFTVASEARTGAVTLIQRFGSALNLNPHLHMLFLDGVYFFNGGRARFYRARCPQRDDLVKLLHSLSGRIVRLLERRGLLIADEEHPLLEIELGSGLDQLQAASVGFHVPVGGPGTPATPESQQVSWRVCAELQASP